MGMQRLELLQKHFISFPFPFKRDRFCNVSDAFSASIAVEVATDNQRSRYRRLRHL